MYYSKEGGSGFIDYDCLPDQILGRYREKSGVSREVVGQIFATNARSIIHLAWLLLFTNAPNDLLQG